MRTLPLAVLALAVLTLPPVHAQPAPAPPPAPVANDPQAVADAIARVVAMVRADRC